MRMILVASLFLLTGCGTLRLSPKSCRTNGVWGNAPTATREFTREEQVEEKTLDLKAHEKFIVFFDRDVRLRDLLEENGIKCEEVKKLRVEIKTTWFIFREVALKVVKNY